jgi:hypothetical protein
MRTPTDDYKMEYRSGTAYIELAGRRNPKELALMAGWLVFWLVVFAVIFAILLNFLMSDLQDGQFEFSSLPISIFLVFGLIFWASRGIPAWRAFLWQIGGLERLEISRDLLKIRKTVFGIGTAREYRRDQIKSVSVVQPAAAPLEFLKIQSKPFEVPVTGPIEVQLLDRKPEFIGFGLKEATAETLRAAIQKQLFPD